MQAQGSSWDIVQIGRKPDSPRMFYILGHGTAKWRSVSCTARILLLGGVFLLLFNLQKKWAEVDSLTEHLDVLGMDVCNVYDGTKVVSGIWGMTHDETKEMFIKHRYVVIVVSEELFLSTSALYYIELARKLYEKGDIKVYVINNGISVEKYPERCKWLTEGVMLKNYSNTADEKTYAYAMDIVLGITYDLFSEDKDNGKKVVKEGTNV